MRKCKANCSSVIGIGFIGSGIFIKRFINVSRKAGKVSESTKASALSLVLKDFIKKYLMVNTSKFKN